jgi:hypothetical protein
MSSEERKKILQMVEEGKISAADAASLMRALDEDEVGDAEAELEVIESKPGSGYESDASSGSRRAAAPEFDEIKARARRFSLIPLWVGVFITVLSAWIIFSIQQNAGVNFWFYCMTLPLMFGVLLITLGAGGRASRWIYVDVDRRDVKPGDGPKRITLGFPIPFGFVAWFFETFGHNISGMNKGRVAGIVQMMHATKESGEPLMVNVDDDDAHVQVYIG